MRRLGFVGSTQREIAQRLLVEVVRDWQKDWCFSPTSDLAFKIFDFPEQWAGPECTWCLSSCDMGQFWVGANWSDLVFSQHVQAVPDDVIRSQVINAAQESLLSNLKKALGVKSSDSLQANAPKEIGTLLDARLLIGFNFGHNWGLLIALDAALLDGFFPRVPRELSLVQRVDAIGGVKVRVQVDVSFSSLELDRVDGLSEGDVLLGGPALLESINFNVTGDKAVARGFLARRNNKLAIQLHSDQN